MAMKDYLKTNDQGKEKHLPDIDVKECSTCGELSVTVQVGKETIHPSTPEHFIKTIILYGVTKEDKLVQLTVFHLGEENTVPRVRTTVKKETFKKLLATSFCNIHGLWENEISL
jgi:superoxide reductase